MWGSRGSRPREGEGLVDCAYMALVRRAKPRIVINRFFMDWGKANTDRNRLSGFSTRGPRKQKVQAIQKLEDSFGGVRQPCNPVTMRTVSIRAGAIVSSQLVHFESKGRCIIISTRFH